MKKKFCRPAGIALAFLLPAVYVTVHAQTRTVTGKVDDGTRPLSGVTVSEEGSGQVTTTNSSGGFTLTVNGQNPVLIFRHPEYTEQMIQAADRHYIEVTLAEKVNTIQEVVLNAGYYDVKAKESTGSIAKVSAKEIENQPVTNVLQAVQGRMAGVSITQNSGTPGGGFDVQIRGRNSLRRDGNSPMYIVDGMVINSDNPSIYSSGLFPYASINPLNAVNPNDVESIEILKDADATAIYGSRGANGVILITTKNGRKGGTRVTYNSSFSLSKVASALKMMDTAAYLEMRAAAFANDGITAIPANAYDLNGKWDKSRYTDWQKVLIGNTAEGSSNQLTLSGGNDASQFNISASHGENTTVFPADYRYKTNTVSSKYAYRPHDKKWEVNVGTILSFTSNNGANQDFTNRALILSPNAPALYDETGALNWENNTFNNPVAPLAASYLNESTNIIQNIGAAYRLNDYLKFRLNTGFSFQYFEEYRLQPHTIYNPSSGLNSDYSSAFKSTRQNKTLMMEPQLDWQRTFGRHSFNVLVGGTYQQDGAQQNVYEGYGFESDAFIQNLGAAKTKLTSENASDYRYAAVFSRVNYKLDDRYILNLTGRRDGSSRFGANNRFANFGAVGAAWIFSREPFLEDASWLSFGKLRGSYGITGSDRIGNYQYLDTYSVSDTYNDISVLNPSRLRNNGFSWEKTAKLETGLELGFWNDRMNLTAAWYRNRSSNQLVGIPLPATTGFSSVQANLPATVENTGWELELSSTPVRDRDITWTASLNASFPRNRLISFPNLEGSTYANQYVIGQPITVVKVYQYEGIDPQTGIYRFTDYNGDGRISSPADNKAIENIGVSWFAGFRNELSYRNWQLSLLLQGVKQKNWNYNSIMQLPGTMNNQPTEVASVWSPSNQQGIYMPYSSGLNAAKVAAHSYFTRSNAAVSDASYIRLKNVQLAYTLALPQSFIKAAQFYVQGQNLLTITDYFGLDPEFLVTGFLPPLKTYSFGLQLTF